MAWWVWLLLGIFILLLLSIILILLLPLRIFVRYLRENKKDQISLRIKLGLLLFRLESGKNAAADQEINCSLAAGRFRIPARPLQKMAGRMKWPGGLADLGKTAAVLAPGRRARALLKKICWTRFDLELSWGFDDPAWTGLAAGGCWALGGLLIGLLQEYFSIAAQPQLRVRPLFRAAGLKLRWEGEAALPVYHCFRLWQGVKKTGGAGSGTSSH